MEKEIRDLYVLMDFFEAQNYVDKYGWDDNHYEIQGEFPQFVVKRDWIVKQNSHIDYTKAFEHVLDTNVFVIQTPYDFYVFPEILRKEVSNRMQEIAALEDPDDQAPLWGKFYHDYDQYWYDIPLDLKAVFKSVLSLHNEKTEN